MDTTTLIVLICFLLLNMTGVGMYHYAWKHESGKSWKCGEFFLNTAILLVIGVTYLISTVFKALRK